MMMTNDGIAPASFRDPSGFIFTKDGIIHRQINHLYKEHYDHLMDSGLYNALSHSGLLIEHEDADLHLAKTQEAYKIITPVAIPFISYPYEWSFSQLKDAALATLAIQKMALEHDMILKDSSAFNIQFINCRPIFIDTLSFEKYEEGQPWPAYKQFCQHFLAPLALAAYTDIRLSKLTRTHLDGIDLDLAARLLPFRTRLRFSLLCHIHLHAKTQKRYADKNAPATPHKVSRIGLMGLADNLESTIKKLTWAPAGTEWANYYDETNYSSTAMEDKKKRVSEYLAGIKPKITWDMGANTGTFSQLSARSGSQTIAFDVDPAVVETHYLDCVATKRENILPLLLDLTNPTPAIGWENTERMSLFERGPTDVVMALAMLHHLTLSNNLPFHKISNVFQKICRWLIIEFVPKSDSQVQRLLATRKDIFPNYTKERFETEFRKHFEILDSAQIADSQRTLYLMRKTNS